MKEDVVIAEEELLISVNNIVQYADYLSRIIDSYTKIILKMREKGIHDQLINSKITLTLRLINSYKASINDICEAVGVDVRSYFDEIERITEITFPG